jgi:hypothetical protein
MSAYQRAVAGLAADMDRQLELGLDRPGKARRDGPDTSKRAALEVAPRTGTQRRRVLDAIASASSGGLTDEQLQTRLGMSGDSERPRRVELVEGGWIKDSGLRRPSGSGQDSIVWELARAVPKEGEAA